MHLEEYQRQVLNEYNDYKAAIQDAYDRMMQRLSMHHDAFLTGGADQPIPAPKASY